MYIEDKEKYLHLGGSRFSNDLSTFENLIILIANSMEWDPPYPWEGVQVQHRTTVATEREHSACVRPRMLTYIM